MYILLPFFFFLGLQFLHRRLLTQIFSVRFRHWISGGLVMIHLPLLVYLVLRFTGHGAEQMGPVLRPLARGALYFQILILINLVFWGIATLVWTVRLRWRRAYLQVPEDPSRRVFLRKSAVVGGGILLAAASTGAKEAYGDPEITRLTLPFRDLPLGMDGLRIVHLSDLHCGPLVGTGLVKRWRVLAERENPDLLVITGDFVDSLPEEMKGFREAFSEFPATLGRFAILGNHDYFTDPRPIWEQLGHMGFQCLENSHVSLSRKGDQIVLLGLQDPMARDGRFQNLRFGPGPMPQDVLMKLPPGSWRICLCHRPSNWNLAQETGANLTLSGHTHGGQINLIPGISSASLLGPYTYGLYKQNEQALYVSRGLGVVGLPMRIAAAPEIAVITLRRQEN